MHSVQYCTITCLLLGYFRGYVRYHSQDLEKGIRSRLAALRLASQRYMLPRLRYYLTTAGTRAWKGWMGAVPSPFVGGSKSPLTTKSMVVPLQGPCHAQVSAKTVAHHLQRTALKLQNQGCVWANFLALEVQVYALRAAAKLGNPVRNVQADWPSQASGFIDRGCPTALYNTLNTNEEAPRDP